MNQTQRSPIYFQCLEVSKQSIGYMIEATPTGPARERLTEINMLLMNLEDHLRKGAPLFPLKGD